MKKIVILFCLSISFFASGSSKKKEKLPILMRQFYATLVEMKPFMISFEEFKNPANKARVQSLIQGLEKKIDTTEVKDLNATGFNLTYDLLAKHLRDTSYLYEKEIYQAAWNNLRATTQFCISCHDRLPKGVGQISWPANQELVKSDSKSQLREADFLYIGHQFEGAMAVYDRVIRNYKHDPKAPDKLSDLEDAYQRKIAFFARIQRDPANAISSLNEDLLNKNLPLETKKDIEAWIHYFNIWKNEGKANPALLTDSNLLDYARDIVEKSTSGRKITVSDPYVVNLFRISGLLYERVFKQAKSAETAEMLYLLGKCERDLAPIRAYSLADIYFKECILQATKKPIAKKCYSEYELSMKQKYRTGASEYIDEGLKTLQKMTE